jgi:predicted solute-binding protein
MTLKFGAPRDLFARPLTKWFETDEAKEADTSIRWASLSQLPKLLQNGELDCALVGPAFSFIAPQFAILETASVSSDSEARCIKFFSYLPLIMAHSAAVDSIDSSATLVMKIVLADSYNSFPQMIVLDASLPEMLRKADSALLVGDEALISKPVGARVFDLGHEWRKLTATPLVLGVWTCRKDAAIDKIETIVRRARDWGTERLENIADEESERMGFSRKKCVDLLENVLIFDYNEDHRNSIQHLHEKARKHALLTK